MTTARGPGSAVVTRRKVGVCAYCGGDVLLRVDPAGARSARCGCGATVIPQGLLARLATFARSRMRQARPYAVERVARRKS